MKTKHIFPFALAIAAIGTATNAGAQKLQADQVPGPVRTTFSTAFPDAMDVEWKRSDLHYHAEFEKGIIATEHEVWYDASGKSIRHEEEINATDLPAAVTAAIHSEFPGYRTDEAERITTDGATSYVAELKMKGHPEWKVAFDAAGKQLEKRED